MVSGGGHLLERGTSKEARGHHASETTLPASSPVLCFVSEIRGGRVRRGSNGANGDAPSSGSARGFDPCKKPPEQGNPIDLAMAIASPRIPLPIEP